MSVLLDPTNSTAQPQAQATPPAEPSAPQEQAQESKPLTEADFRRIAREEATRTAQSLVDKASYRLSREAQDRIEALRMSWKDAGLTEEQAQAKINQIAMSDLTSKPQPSQASEEAPDFEPSGNPAADLVASIFDETAVAIGPDDPEYKDIMAAWNDPKGSMPKLAHAAYLAVEAKKNRTQAQNNSAPLRTPGGASGAPGNTMANSAHDYWSAAYKK